MAICLVSENCFISYLLARRRAFRYFPPNTSISSTFGPCSAHSSSDFLTIIIFAIVFDESQAGISQLLRSSKQPSTFLLNVRHVNQFRINEGLSPMINALGSYETHYIVHLSRRPTHLSGRSWGDCSAAAFIGGSQNMGNQGVRRIVSASGTPQKIDYFYQQRVRTPTDVPAFVLSSHELRPLFTSTSC